MIYLLFAVISGFLTGLSFDLPAFGYLAWFSFIPFLFVINKSSFKKGILYSFGFGFVYYLTVIFWVGNVSKLGLLLLLVYLSLYTILFFICGRIYLQKPFAIITIPCLWVFIEFLKENIWCGFGWANLGYSQYNNLHLIQSAEIFGVKFISFVMVMANVLFFEIFSKKRLLLYKVLLTAGVLLSIFGYSFFRLHNFTGKEIMNLSLVQPNVSEELKWEPAAQADIIEKLKTLSSSIAKDSLIIFPEAAWPLTVSDSNYDLLYDFVRGIKRDVIMGAVISEKDNFYNTAIMFNKDAKLLGIYRKIRLVPFGEYVPLRKLFTFISVINSVGDMSAGKEHKIFSYKDKKFSVLICFEDIFPLFVADLANRRDFLINITNDAWFNGDPEASQHLGIMVLRAVENRISIARCANSGISGWVSYKGEIHKLKSYGKEIDASGVLNFDLPLKAQRTLYNKWGEVFVYFCMVFLAVVVLVKKPASRKPES